MAFNFKQSENLPPSVGRAVLETGTVISQKYYVHELLCYSGNELYYHVQDVKTGAHFLLSELLPFQWCILDYEGNFVPIRRESAVQWEAVQNAMIERLKKLHSLSEQEEAIPKIRDILQERGTIFYSQPIRQEISLGERMGKGLLSPEEAMQLFAPVLDTLAGLHQESIFHGALTETAIWLEEDACILRDWMSGADSSGMQEDVRAVSLLLYRAMTGESVFHDETAQQLPETVRNALYNGIYDTRISITELWHQLHAKQPVKRVQAVQPKKANIFTLSTILAVLFCGGCIWLFLHPVQISGAWSPKAKHVLPDVSYSVPENMVQLPEVLYLPKEKAVEQLESLGLRPVLVRRVENPVIPEGQIVTQSPSAGSVVEMGDTITLSVSQGWMSTVPDVCDMPVEKATQLLESLGFVVETEGAISDSTAPDAIIYQDVSPDTKLERESVIHLLVSLGQKNIDSSQMVTMPDCSGMTFSEAKTLLSEQFLYAVLDDRILSQNVPAGQILSQSVARGEEVPQGSTVHFVVSLGAEKTSVPNVIGMKSDEAKTTLENANLRCVLCYVSSGDHEIETVIQQNYEADTVLPINTEVWLTVSIGTASRVESLGGWSGNPLPDPNAPPTEAPPENPPENEIPPENENPPEDENQEITNPPSPN